MYCPPVWMARSLRAVDPEVEIAVHDRVAAVADGEELFIGRTISAVACGLPGAAGGKVIGQ